MQIFYGLCILPIIGSTSGIGKDFAEYLAKAGMNILVVSRSVDKLEGQVKELKAKYPKIEAEYLAYDFTKVGEERSRFYAQLHERLQHFDQNGGISMLINNVGSANEIPKNIEEFTDEDIDGMIQCNIYSTVFMTRAVFKYMRPRKQGAIVSISSGSGNAATPYLAVYSATKAFITQFSRSLKVEWWDSGVDFLVVTPYYVVSNLYKRSKVKQMIYKKNPIIHTYSYIFFL
jgi:17beta-estradiol 17-dehydrogenase / very-long-chain 3-oxoacyl-CoA reductase